MPDLTQRLKVAGLGVGIIALGVLAALVQRPPLITFSGRVALPDHAARSLAEVRLTSPHQRGAALAHPEGEGGAGEFHLRWRARPPYRVTAVLSGVLFSPQEFSLTGPAKQPLVFTPLPCRNGHDDPAAWVPSATLELHWSDKGRLPAVVCSVCVREEESRRQAVHLSRRLFDLKKTYRRPPRSWPAAEVAIITKNPALFQRYGLGESLALALRLPSNQWNVSPDASGHWASINYRPGTRAAVWLERLRLRTDKKTSYSTAKGRPGSGAHAVEVFFTCRLVDLETGQAYRRERVRGLWTPDRVEFDGREDPKVRMARGSLEKALKVLMPRLRKAILPRQALDE